MASPSRLESLEQWQDLIAARKDAGAKDSSNGFITPSEISRFADEGSARFAETKSALLLFLMQEDFARMHILADMGDGDKAVGLDDNQTNFLSNAIDEIGLPVLAEFSFRGDMPRKMGALASMLGDLGFAPYTTERRYVLPVGDDATFKDPDGFRVCAAAKGDIDKASAIWSKSLRPFQTYLPQGEALEEMARNGGILVAKSVDGNDVAGAMLARKSGKTYTFGPVAIDSDFRGKGLSKALYSAALKQVSADGATRVVAWVEEGNSASEKLHEAMGFAPDGNITKGFLRKNA